MTDLRASLRLMLVVEDQLLGGQSPFGICEAAVRGGVTSILLRPAGTTPRELAHLARGLVARVPVPVLVGGRADVAVAAGAAGVHLEPDEVPVPLARRIAPLGFTIGVSVGTAGEAAAGRGADFWSVGPWGRAGQGESPVDRSARFRGLVRLAEGRPCIAQAGVHPPEIPEIVACGACGIAVTLAEAGPDAIETALLPYAAQISGRQG